MAMRYQEVTQEHFPDVYEQLSTTLATSRVGAEG
jgi:hypothetical protein